MTTSPIIIFLDIDGVLRVDGVNAKRELDKGAVSRLRWFARSVGAQVVISSTWRHVSPLSFFTEAIGDFVIGITPFIPENSSGVRQREIKAWLTNNRPGASWLAIDDSPDLFFPTCPRLLLCDPKRGFDLSAFNQLIALPITEKS